MAETTTLGQRAPASILQLTVRGALPGLPSAGRSAPFGGGVALPVAPGRWWLLDADAPDAVGSVVELTDSRVVLRLSGPHAREVLAGLAAVDFSEAAFPPGAVAVTTGHHVPLLVHHAPDGAGYDLYVPRSCAAWLRALLAAEVG